MSPELLFRFFYWPICRAYARRLGDKPADALMRRLCTLQFFAVHGYYPNFVSPRRFSEKLWSRMLHERDPLLTLISDKLGVRDHVAATVGDDCLIPLLWSGDAPEDIPFDELPPRFVIKTNHGCGYNIIVKDKAQLDQAGARRQLARWLGQNFGLDTYLGIAWGYKNIRPRILIESFIEDSGKVPADCKCWCFAGRVEFITLHFDRFEDSTLMAVDRNFEPWELSINHPLPRQEFKRPPNSQKIVQLAESLAQEFPFMRVDLYNVRDRVYFGELTPYPGACPPVTSRIAWIAPSARSGLGTRDSVLA